MAKGLRATVGFSCCARRLALWRDEKFWIYGPIENFSCQPNPALCRAIMARRLEYGRRMAKLGVSRGVLAGMLRNHGEDDLAERALSLSDDELARIGTLGAYYAFSEDAMALGGSMGGTRALSLAAIDVLENRGRDLRWSRTESERGGSSLTSLQKTTS